MAERLEHRYEVRKVNDPTGKHDACRYFVLDPAHDQLARQALAEYARLARVAGHHGLADDLEEWQHHARRVVIPDPPASVAEPECGCSLYTRCELHENGRARNCTCNGPTYRNSTCGIAEHRMVASSMPDRDPALLD